MTQVSRTKELTNKTTDETSTNVNPTERAASVVAGGALVAFGIKQGGIGGTLLSVLGGGMLLRGATGHCHVYDVIGVDTASEGGSAFNRLPLPSGKVHVKKSLTINKPAEELYTFWRNFENLPIFMTHLESVTTTDATHSHWKAKAPLGQTVEWDAEVTSDIQNRRIGWKSLDGSDIPNSGVIEFSPTPDRGTEVNVSLTYDAPGGKIGEWIAWGLGEEPSVQVADDLRRFKSLMETGLIMKTDGQPSGREPIQKALTATAR